jgi:hypothetical protein
MRREVPAVQAEYIDVERARALPGCGSCSPRRVPGRGARREGRLPRKKIAFARVAQAAGADNDEICSRGPGTATRRSRCTRTSRARTSWAEILWLAERLSPSLARARDPEDRVLLLRIARS